ncbi:MAG: hypothetical protein PHE09_02620 [Oscillospiraceae bacterium]|nr:hypothetical protein [Oscillospiraceae bacterium]
MKTKKDFFDDFFTRLADNGFRVECIMECDIAAEVYDESSLFCVVTQDGELIFEKYESGKARILEQAAEESRSALGCCTRPPFADMERMEPVLLTGGSYIKVFESAGTVLLCRRTGLFGYEFVTCQKAMPKHNTRRFYREQFYYDSVQAQDSFMERSGLKIAAPLSFSHDELRVLVSCCARCVMLDNELDSGNESRIRALMARIEENLPPQPELSPRHYFQNEM